MPMFDQVEQGEIRRLARQEIKTNNTSIDSNTFDKIDDIYWDNGTLVDSLYMPNGFSLGTAPHAWVSASGASFLNSTITFGPVCTLSTTTTANSRAWIRNADQDLPTAPSNWSAELYNTNMLEFEWRGKLSQYHSNIGKGAGQAAVIVGLERTHATLNELVHGFMVNNGRWYVVIWTEYSELYSYDTGISAYDTHTLKVVLSNMTPANPSGNKIFFYIDDVLVNTVTNFITANLATEYPPYTGYYYGCHIRQRGAGNPVISLQVESMKAKRSKIQPHVHYDLTFYKFGVNTNLAGDAPNFTLPNPLGDGQFAYNADYGAAMTALASTNGNVNCPLGQTLFKEIRNNTGTTITAGQVVYVTGSHASTHITVALADASTEATAKSTIGVAAHDILNNSEGWIITQGYLKGIRTNTTSGTGGEGSTLWLSTTAGEFTYDRPTSPDHGVVVGWMVKSAGAGAGSIFVKIANGQELDELHDVKITSIADNDLLQWDNTDLRWENRTIAAAGIAAASHTHTMADITDLREQKIFVETECNAAGEFSTISLNSGGNSFTGTGIDTTGGHYGILTSTTSTNAAAVAGLGSADTTTATIFGTFKVETTAIIMIPALSTSTERFFIECGFTDNRSGVPVDGVLIQYCDNVNSGKWLGMAYNNNVLTTVDLGVTVAANTWYKMNIIVQTDGKVDFYIDGTLKGSLAAGSAPTGSTRATSLSHTIRKSVGTTSRTLYLDYINYVVWCSR